MAVFVSTEHGTRDAYIRGMGNFEIELDPQGGHSPTNQKGHNQMTGRRLLKSMRRCAACWTMTICNKYSGCCPGCHETILGAVLVCMVRGAR